MQRRSIVCLLVLIVSSSGGVCTVGFSSTNDVFLHGAGVIITLTFPEETHPGDSIMHNLTITANSSLTLENFTIVINARVDAGWQQVYKEQLLFLDMLANESLTRQIRFTLPSIAQGSLQCSIRILTRTPPVQYVSYTFNTTEVRTLTYGELLSQYNQLLANYSGLLSNYEELLESYAALSFELGTLNLTYSFLLAEYTTLQATHTALNSNYATLHTSYDTLLSSYSFLMTNYTSLNQTCLALETEIVDFLQQLETLQLELNNTRMLLFVLVGTTVVLIALVVYIKKKKPEPYLVIRKETVAVNRDKKP